MYEGEELTPEVIAKYMQTPEGAAELQRLMADGTFRNGTTRMLSEMREMEAQAEQDRQSGQGYPYQGLGDGSQIGASPSIPGATRGLPLEQIGASPNIPGATRGPSSGIGGIIPEDENRRRMRGVLSGQGLGY